MVFAFHFLFATLFLAIAAVAPFWHPILWALVGLIPLYALGVVDTLQREHAILRNFPILGHFRYLFELIRPEIQQYFIETNTDGAPLNREVRSVAYQRAKGDLQTLPFGTQRDVYAPGYEWIDHSLLAQAPPQHEVRIRIGGERCKLPYDASLLNISAMSFGALSSAAVLALNDGAKRGGFCHNTGEGGISAYHLKHGGDLCWQVGTGYFGARNSRGEFDGAKFADNAARPTVKMIELKLSQGAKPGHGGILPAAKITDEIAEIRGVGKGQDIVSPPRHSAFSGPIELLELIERLRELSGGKPVGFKLCLGIPTDFISIAKAMVESECLPDFITVDGGEGGTGAAPLEFSNSVGAPLFDGLVFVHNVLTGFGVRDRIRLIASGKTVTGFDIAARLAAGADLVASARAFLLSLGCIQVLRCHSNHCPTGIATQRPDLVRGLVPSAKAERVMRFHAQTVHAFYELLGAAGLSHPDDLRPWHIHRRVSQTEVKNYAQIYTYLNPGELLHEPAPKGWRELMAASDPHSFAPVGRERRW